MELTSLKFVSDKREKDFNKLNIYTVEELAKHFPRDYLDLTHVTYLRDAYHNDVLLTLCEVQGGGSQPLCAPSVRQGAVCAGQLYFQCDMVQSAVCGGQAETRRVSFLRQGSE